MKNKITISFILLICFLFAGCSDDYQEDFTFTGTVEEILVEEEMLVMKEYGGVMKEEKREMYMKYPLMM